MYVDEEGLFPDFFDSSVGETAEFTGTLSVSTSAGVSAIGLLQDRMTGAVSTVQPILRDLEITGLRTGTSRGFFGGVSAYAAKLLDADGMEVASTMLMGSGHVCG